MWPYNQGGLKIKGWTIEGQHCTAYPMGNCVQAAGMLTSVSLQAAQFGTIEGKFWMKYR